MSLATPNSSSQAFWSLTAPERTRSNSRNSMPGCAASMSAVTRSLSPLSTTDLPGSEKTGRQSPRVAR